jgi:hypothetical protein
MNSRALRFIKPAAVGTAIAISFMAGRHCPQSEEIVKNSGSCRLSVSEDESARFVELIAKRALRKSALELRHELNAGIDGELEIRYSISVSREGRLGLKESEILCRNCTGESELPELIGMLIVNEFGMIPRKDACTLELRVPVPALGVGREESPVIRLPENGAKGVEL